MAGRLSWSLAFPRIFVVVTHGVFVRWVAIHVIRRWHPSDLNRHLLPQCEIHRMSRWPFQVAKDALLDAKNKGVVEALLTNGGFMDLSSSVEALGKKLDCIKAISLKGFRPLFDAGAVQDWRAVFGLGIDTVATTYALHQLTVEIPKIQGIFDRKEAVKKLRADVDSKGGVFGASLESRAVTLETQVKLT